MKKLFLSLSIILTLTLSTGSFNKANAGYVNGYYRSNGTYVQPYYRSNLNGLRYDNYSYAPSQPLYNNSYGTYNTYKWNAPSYITQPDYYTGLNSYNYSHSIYVYPTPYYRSFNSGL